MAALLLALAMTGCGVSGDEAEVRRVAERFDEAVRKGDGLVACEQLSTETVQALEGQLTQVCEDLVLGLEYEGGRIEAAVVYVTNAKVDLSSGESAFLAKEPEGWRLVGVACRRESGDPREHPLECEVEA